MRAQKIGTITQPGRLSGRPNEICYSTESLQISTEAVYNFPRIFLRKDCVHNSIDYKTLLRGTFRNERTSHMSSIGITGERKNDFREISKQSSQKLVHPDFESIYDRSVFDGDFARLTPAVNPADVRRAFSHRLQGQLLTKNRVTTLAPPPIKEMNPGEFNMAFGCETGGLKNIHHDSKI